MPALPEFAFTNEGGVVLDLRRDRLLKLNTVGADMWAQLNLGKSEVQVVENISRRYSADPQRVLEDLHSLLKQAAELGLSPESVVLATRRQSESLTNKNDLPSLGAKASTSPRPPNRFDVVKAFLGLAVFDLMLACRSLEFLCSIVKWWPVKPSRDDRDSSTIGRICNSVERAAVWYPKKVLCLQRSAVAVCFLREQGIPARLVVGIRPMPFIAHAWVEVDGIVANDVQRVNKFYQSLTSY
jgi:hypothetical protein